MNPAVLGLADLLPRDVGAVGLVFLATLVGSIPALTTTLQQVLHHGVRLCDHADAPAMVGEPVG